MMLLTSLSRPEIYSERFSNDLSQVQGIRPFETDYLPEEEPTAWAVNRFMAFNAQPNTLYLPPAFVEAYNMSGSDYMSFQPRSSSSHRKSSHGVFFGDLRIGRGTIGLAIKPHEDGDAWSPAVREQLITGAFRKLGFHTLSPMGVMLIDSEDEGPRAYGLTMLYEALTTFDSMDWSKFYTDRDKHPAMRNMWRSLARTFATMHDRGTMCHNDAWGRNAATSLFNEGFEIDEELATIDLNEVRDADVRFGRSQKDLITLGKTICYPLAVPYDHEIGLGIVSDHHSQEWSEVFNNVFLKDYLRVRRSLMTKHQSIQEQHDIADELDELKRDMRMHFDYFQDRHIRHMV